MGTAASKHRPCRRKIDLADLNAVGREVKSLHASGYRCAGAWHLGQIAQHLAMAMNWSVWEFPFRLPWIVRGTVGPLFRRRALSTRRLPTGLPAPKVFRVDPDVDEAPAVTALLAAIGTVQAHNGPWAVHPAFNRLTGEQWRTFHAIHASHHLSFLVP